MRKILILRKPAVDFNSIEKVFTALIPYLAITICLLPKYSKGLFGRLYNILFVFTLRKSLLHLSGHDNYIFSIPFFKKTVLTIHDLEGLHKYEGVKRWIYYFFWIKLPVKNASVITTVSTFSKNEIIENTKTKKNIYLIHNPLTLPISYTPKKFNATKPRILHIGTKANKNLERLIHALSKLNCELVIIGQKSDQLLNQLNQAKIDFTFKSNLSNEEMVEEYKACDILVFVSTYEGFGLPIIEAQAAGRAVITANVASMPEVAGEGALLVDPYSVDDIREGIVKLIEDEDFRESLIQRGLENVKRVDAEEIAKQYREVYDAIDNFIMHN